MTMVATVTKCLRCGTPLSAGAIEGFCQRCLAVVAFAASGEEEPASAGAVRPTRLGVYELIEEIGRGGMGVVYRARQLGLNREVAVKVLRQGPFADASEVARFRREAAAAAALRHPNIVAVHEVGEADGHAFFSMDLVRGETLAELTGGGPMEASRAARYVEGIAAAVAAAHAQGILHRDLKPANVIIDADDQPRVTDFGLAKRLDVADATVTQQVVGSPGYMPPEQADPQHGKLTVASDVYALGALLYHLLTSRPPFASATIPATLAQVLNTDPVPPRRLNPAIPADLETICRKCLQKEPERRYPSAQELADELTRFLGHEPIRARPISPPEKLWRWSRRKPLLASLILLVQVVGALGLLGILWQWRRAERSAEAEHRERDTAQAANRDLQRANLRLAETIGLLELERAEDLFRSGDAANGVAHLAAMLRRDPSYHIAASRLVSALVHRDWALPATPPMRHRERVMMAGFSPEARFVLTAGWDKTARVWEAATGQPLATFQHDGALVSARYSPDGRRIVTASDDGTARIWDAMKGGTLQEPSVWSSAFARFELRHDGKVNWAEFSRDDQLVVTASADKSARVWDAASGALKQELRGHKSEILLARFSPDGKFVATATAEGTLHIWNTESGKEMFRTNAHVLRINALAFSPDGRRLISAGDDHTARLWNAMTGAVLGNPIVHRLVVWHAVFSHDGKLILTTCEDGTARLWDAQTLRPISGPLRHESGVVFGEFSPDGQSVVTTSSDNTARVWDVRTGTALWQPLRHVERVVHASFSADGRRLVTASLDGAAQVWDLRERFDPGTEIHHDVNVAPIAFSSDGAALLTAAHDKTARMWNARTGQPLCEPMHHDSFLLSGDVAPDRRRVVLSCADGTTRIWDCGDWKAAPGMAASPRVVAGPLQHSKAVRSVRFNPDGSRIVTASADGTARVWNAINGQPITEPLGHSGEVLTAQFSRDGRMIVTASQDRTARVWDAQSGQPITEPLVHLDHVHWAEFSPDSERVVTASSDNTVCIWNVRTGRPIMPPLPHPRMVGRAVFRPDGRRIATASIDRMARIWDASTGQGLTPPLGHDSFVERVFFTSDGQRLVTTCRSGLARIWDSTTGRPLTEWLNAGTYWDACFDPVAERIAVGTMEGIIRIWEIPRAPTPVPARFLDLAEAVAGIRLSERGNVEFVSREQIKKFAHELAAKDAVDSYEQLAKWFLADPTQRPHSWAEPK
jgi:WD40 repeat protein/serine/threonine protein kinase